MILYIIVLSLFIYFSWEGVKKMSKGPWNITSMSGVLVWEIHSSFSVVLWGCTHLPSLLSMFQFGATGVQPSPAKTTHRLLCFERCCDKGWNLMTVPPPSTLASMKPLLDIIHQAHKSIIRVNQEGGKTELPLVPVGSKQLPSFL